MYARRMSLQLRPNSIAALTERVEKLILPLLRQEKGFQDQIMLVAGSGSYALGISLWDSPENADAYHAGTFAEVTRILADLLTAAPKVKSFAVINSTLPWVEATAMKELPLSRGEATVLWLTPTAAAESA